MNPQAPPDVIYPETDGEPIGETDLHIDWIFRLRSMLKWHFRDQQVYVATNLLLYFEEGVPRRYVVPDVFVVKNSSPERRRVYKIWEEGQPPHFVLEVTSVSTRREDEVRKPDKYAEIGVREYFLYDPTADYLRPALAGYRLDGDDYIPIEPDESGRLHSEELGLYLRLEEGELVLYDGDSGERLLTRDEAQEKEANAAEQQVQAARQEAQAARQEAQAAKQAAQVAEQKSQVAEQAARAAEEQNQRLRELLGRHGIEEE